MHITYMWLGSTFVQLELMLPKYFPVWLYKLYPHQQCMRIVAVPFGQYLLQLILFILDILVCTVISHQGFNLLFSDN